MLCHVSFPHFSYFSFKLCLICACYLAFVKQGGAPEVWFCDFCVEDVEAKLRITLRGRLSQVYLEDGYQKRSPAKLQTSISSWP